MSASVEFADLVAARLKAHPGVSAIVGARVYDGRSGARTVPYISLGPSDSVREDFDCIAGRRETLQVDCWVADGGKLWPARELTDAVVSALHDFAGEMTGGNALVAMQITLARVVADPDGIHGHGIVQVEGLIEEAA